jgi:hypothetical protein
LRSSATLRQVQCLLGRTLKCSEVNPFGSCTSAAAYFCQYFAFELLLGEMSFDLNISSERESIFRFRFYKRDIVTISGQTQWNPALRRESDGKLQTTRRRYVFTPTEGICILLRRLSSSCRWTDLQAEFGRHNAALVEIFYAALDSFFDTFNQLVTKWPSDFVQNRKAQYAQCIKSKGAALPLCVGFIDGTCLPIARPQGLAQRATYSGHKRQNCLNFQAITARMD